MTVNREEISTKRIFMNLMRGDTRNTRSKVIGIYLLLIGANLAAWVWALIAFRHFPLLLGSAALAYSFGLRHAVDADHIAAIDNVTRKLMQDGERPVAVGLFFSLGHSTIVILIAAAVAATATSLVNHAQSLQAVGSVIGTAVSALFLLAIALMNVVILCNVYKTFQRAKAGEKYEEEELNILLSGRGWLSRLIRPLFGMIRKSWHMYPLGFLFGLGFETATEVGVLAIAAMAAGKGLSIWSIMAFPVLFTAGMSLVDTTDGVLMLGAYGWAFVKPIRKLYYNMTITAVSVVVAVAIGGIETLGLIGDECKLSGPFWDLMDKLNDNFGTIGFLIIGIFLASWLLATLIYRMKEYDKLDVEVIGQ